MENASKALIMAGSVLIALVIIGALLLMINNLSSYQESDTASTREAQVVEFNNQYETYNRKNVRGSDLYSLLNRVVDYNSRKSYKGTGTKDEGQDLAYIPMTITFDLGSNWNSKDKFWVIESSEKSKHLIQQRNYTVSDTNNEFEDQIYDTVDTLEKTYGSDSLNNLVTGMSKIFIDEGSSPEAKQEAIDTFNIASKKKTANNFADLKGYKLDVQTYAEYVQFKRAKFDCKDPKYDSKTGRIIEMNFEFMGKFE